MDSEDKKICKIGDVRLVGYKERTRSGSEQIFYTGNDERDFDRYRAEGGTQKAGVKMHDKPDTIRIHPPEKHYYAQLIDGEWWWVNGCYQCNGRPRDWMSYVECEKHDVCRTCKLTRAKLTEPPWGGKKGWQCKPCAEAEREALKRERLEAVASKEYNEWDYYGNDKIVCPHCESNYERDCDVPEGDEICEVCGGEYTVEPEYSVTFTTKCKGERLTV